MTPSLFIGIDTGGTETKGALVTRAGEVVDRAECATEPHAATKSIISLAETLIERASEIGAVAEAIGVGAAGFVDAERGAVTFSPNLEYDDPDLREAFGARVDVPVVIDNDANAAAWGEYRFGSAAGSRDLACVTLGTGIGSGFVVGGRLLRGATGAGAEFGHTVIDPDGPRCPCGRKGCIERFASGSGIADMARVAIERDPTTRILDIAGRTELVTARHVVQAANEMDATAREVLRKAGRMLGVALANIVNLFEPVAIVLAGSVVRAGEPLLGPARDELARACAAQRRRPVRLDVTRLGNDSGILGAAALAADAVEGRA